jgi:hypothetical protein
MVGVEAGLMVTMRLLEMDVPQALVTRQVYVPPVVAENDTKVAPKIVVPFNFH